MIIRALLGDVPNPLGVIIVGLVLASAHCVMSVAAARRSRAVYYAIVFILVGDSTLAIWVDPQALALVLFTLVLAGLGAMQVSRRWLSAR